MRTLTASGASSGATCPTPGSVARRVYRATPAGEEALAAAKLKVRELFGELFEDNPELGGR